MKLRAEHLDILFEAQISARKFNQKTLARITDVAQAWSLLRNILGTLGQSCVLLDIYMEIFSQDASRLKFIEFYSDFMCRAGKTTINVSSISPKWEYKQDYAKGEEEVTALTQLDRPDASYHAMFDILLIPAGPTDDTTGKRLIIGNTLWPLWLCFSPESLSLY
jgi:hypothetical protein